MARVTVNINLDAAFEEGKHPRGEGGEFTHQGHAETTAAGYEHAHSKSGHPVFHGKNTTVHTYTHPQEGKMTLINRKSGKLQEWVHDLPKGGSSFGDTPASLSRHLSNKSPRNLGRPASERF